MFFWSWSVLGYLESVVLSRRRWIGGVELFCTPHCCLSLWALFPNQPNIVYIWFTLNSLLANMITNSVVRLFFWDYDNAQKVIIFRHTAEKSLLFFITIIRKAMYPERIRQRLIFSFTSIVFACILLRSLWLSFRKQKRFILALDTIFFLLIKVISLSYFLFV